MTILRVGLCFMLFAGFILSLCSTQDVMDATKIHKSISTVEQLQNRNPRFILPGFIPWIPIPLPTKPSLRTTTTPRTTSTPATSSTTQATSLPSPTVSPTRTTSPTQTASPNPTASPSSTRNPICTADPCYYP